MRNYKAFTLVELLVAITILSIVLIISTSSILFINAGNRRIQVSEQIYEDTRFLMERIVKEFRAGTIDYEEYWSKKVLNSSEYGQNFGEYSKTFIDPGTDPDTGFQDEFGTECVDRDTGLGSNEQTPPCPPEMRIAPESIDQSIGQNPFSGNADFSNAVCQSQNSNTCENNSHHNQEELYIISSNGLKKTILKRIGNGIDEDNNSEIDDGGKDDTGKEQLAMLKLIRENTSTNEWKNNSDFIDINIKDQNIDDFVTLTPSSIEIVDLKFFISPIENPQKAFRETKIQYQPHVTIILTAKASKEIGAGIRGPAPKITLQTTIASRIYNEVK